MRPTLAAAGAAGLAAMIVAPMAPAALQNWQNVVAGTAPVETNAVTAAAVNVDADLEEVEIWRIFLVLLGLMVLAESLLGNRYLNIKTGSF